MSTKKKTSPAKPVPSKPAGDPQVAERQYHALDNQLRTLKNELYVASQEVVTARRALAEAEAAERFAAAKLQAVAGMVGDLVQRAVSEKPHDEALLKLLINCKQAPWAKLANEKPKGETIAYDSLLAAWKAGKAR